jgi:proline iminopeptidase
MYPLVEPYHTDYLQVSELHSMYFEEVGNPDGQPVVFVHGGPGGGIFPNCRRFFDPKHYRVILFDQRGAGQSKPYSELRENTTQDLIADMELLREHLQIEQWIVFGGSWGSTLSLAYAIQHPEHVRALVLRGIFLGRTREIEWLYGPNGAACIFPQEYKRFIEFLNPEERDTPVHSYYIRLTEGTEDERLRAAWEWDIWESSISQLIPYARDWDNSTPDEWQESLAIARIETHYFVNNSFFPNDQYLLDGAATLDHIPTTIVNGRYDVICPCITAFELAEVMPHAEVIIVPDTGHSSMERGTSDVLTATMNRLKNED